MKNALKVLYIIIVGTGVFYINDLTWLLAIILLHFILFLSVKNKDKSLSFLFKVKWFIALIFLFQAFTGSNDIELLKIKKWIIGFSYEGINSGSIMVAKLISMLFVTQVVRLSMSGKEFVSGMINLGLNRSSAEIIDEIMSIVSENPNMGGGKGQGGGSGKNKNNNTGSNSNEEVKSRDVLLKGKVGNIPKKLLQKINFAKDKFENNPNAVVASSALAVTLIRMVKIAPGLPIAPGHKNILVIPVFVNGIVKSRKRWAGIQIGFISGVLHFTMGFGKYGPLGIFQFALLGGVIDILLKIFQSKTNLFVLLLIGAISGLARISSEILLAFVLGMPDTFYLIYLPYLISHVAFGFASGFISKSIINQ